MEREWHYRDENGAEYGPYTREELEQYAREGRISSGGTVSGPDDLWNAAAESGLEFPADMDAMSGKTPPVDSDAAIAAAASTANAPGNKSPHSRMAYILLGVLLPILACGLAGINNLMVGRTGPGSAQLVLALAGIFFNGIGMFVGITVCIGIPIWVMVAIWSIVEASTNTLDGDGRVMS